MLSLLLIVLEFLLIVLEFSQKPNPSQAENFR